MWVGESSFWYRPTRVVPDQRPLNGRRRRRSSAKNGDLYYIFLTMEMNERGYKIKGPHWNALHYYSNGDL